MNLKLININITKQFHVYNNYQKYYNIINKIIIILQISIYIIFCFNNIINEC